MARGYELNRLRWDALSSLGRHLCRRSGSRCELCEEKGVSLKAIEVPPLPEEPDPDFAVILCHRCHDGVAGGEVDPQAWHFLERAAWNQTPAVQVTAVRMLRRLSAEGVGWPAEILEGLYLDPDVEAWVG